MVEQFAYPNNGAGAAYEHMAQQLAALGSTLTLNCPVKRIVIKNGRACVIETEKGFFSCDQVVSTMPLTDVIDGSDAFSQEVKEASKQLSYRNTTLVYLCIDAKDVFRDNWIGSIRVNH